MHVLFVCTGNICRSPTAERLAAACAARPGVKDFRASSAGTRAVIGHPIHPNAVKVLKSLGADESNFAARQLTPTIASSADLILTMTKSHRDAVLEIAPRQLRRTFTLTEAARIAPHAADFTDLAALRSVGHHASDITDPIGQDESVFQTVGFEIAELLPPIIELCLRS